MVDWTARRCWKNTIKITNLVTDETLQKWNTPQRSAARLKLRSEGAQGSLLVHQGHESISTRSVTRVNTNFGTVIEPSSINVSTTGTSWELDRTKESKLFEYIAFFLKWLYNYLLMEPGSRHHPGILSNSWTSNPILVQYSLNTLACNEITVIWSWTVNIF